ncbi:MAG: class I SAM-dependent methyltransferase [Candidatus Hydrogenedentes bacterium]|nr:class I SAM-dependent methyltransferase [Candidatus Hydrogenedentota bacterium]
MARSLSWYFGSNEYTNFTYDISEKCEKYLTIFIANALDRSHEEVISYLKEIKNNAEIREYFMELVPRTEERYFADLPIKFGRRVGWYVLLRILKPRIVVESGVDRGIGTCVLAAAMLRNAEQGYSGKIIGLDINPYAGRYVAEPYSSVVDLVFGDSLEFLRHIGNEIDVFIHDSNHSREHEAREYELVGLKLSHRGVIVSDNAAVTDCLYEFAKKRSMVFSYWQEEVILWD